MSVQTYILDRQPTNDYRITSLVEYFFILPHAVKQNTHKKKDEKTTRCQNTQHKYRNFTRTRYAEKCSVAMSVFVSYIRAIINFCLQIFNSKKLIEQHRDSGDREWKTTLPEAMFHVFSSKTNTKLMKFIFSIIIYT